MQQQDLLNNVIKTSPLRKVYINSYYNRNERTNNNKFYTYQINNNRVKFQEDHVTGRIKNMNRKKYHHHHVKKNHSLPLIPNFSTYSNGSNSKYSSSVVNLSQSIYDHLITHASEYAPEKFVESRMHICFDLGQLFKKKRTNSPFYVKHVSSITALSEADENGELPYDFRGGISEEVFKKLIHQFKDKGTVDLPFVELEEKRECLFDLSNIKDTYCQGINVKLLVIDDCLCYNTIVKQQTFEFYNPTSNQPDFRMKIMHESSKFVYQDERKYDCKRIIRTKESTFKICKSFGLRFIHRSLFHVEEGTEREKYDTPFREEFDVVLDFISLEYTKQQAQTFTKDNLLCHVVSTALENMNLLLVDAEEMVDKLDEGPVTVSNAYTTSKDEEGEIKIDSSVEDHFEEEDIKIEYNDDQYFKRN